MRIARIPYASNIVHYKTTLHTSIESILVHHGLHRMPSFWHRWLHCCYRYRVYHNIKRRLQNQLNNHAAPNKHRYSSNFVTTNTLCFLRNIMLTCVCMRSMAWLATRVSLRLVRMPAQTRRSRRLHAALAAAPILLARVLSSIPNGENKQCSECWRKNTLA